MDKPHLMQCFNRFDRLAGKNKCDEARKLVEEKFDGTWVSWGTY